jgi:hypothetical protein
VSEQLDAELDRDVSDSLRVIQQGRSARKTAVLIGLAAVLILGFGATALMYSDTAARASPPKIGERVLD